MTFEQRLPTGQQADLAVGQIIKIACFAVGGQGGGVLNGWIVDLAERNAFDVQATSVAGVAQRTGATIYYVEMMPKGEATPVFALAPSEGDVDVLIAAELMEAGRAMTRGFVTPGKTHCIVSTHRQLATVEKIVPGTGEADAHAVLAALEENADQLIAHDLQKIAETSGTVISAALFGALAGSNVLPFDVESFRETIRASNRGVDKSLAAFDAALRIAKGEVEPGPVQELPQKLATPAGPARLRDRYATLQQRLSALPPEVVETAGPGLQKTVTFQDLDYGDDYLTQVETAVQEDRADKGYAYAQTLAKYLANAMAYDDTIRVADVKTKLGRFAQIEAEVGAKTGTLTKITEYTHPGAAEIISMMPRKLGLWFEASAKRHARLDRLVNKGRRIRTDRLSGFLSLYLVAGLKPWRRALLRHSGELAHIEDWLAGARAQLGVNYDFAVALLRTRRLIKGYSDTHSRGVSKYSRVIEASTWIADRDDAAAWMDRLIQAALADEAGEQLDGALQTIRSFAAPDEDKTKIPINRSAAE